MKSNIAFNLYQITDILLNLGNKTSMYLFLPCRARCGACRSCSPSSLVWRGWPTTWPKRWRLGWLLPPLLNTSRQDLYVRCDLRSQRMPVGKWREMIWILLSLLTQMNEQQNVYMFRKTNWLLCFFTNLLRFGEPKIRINFSYIFFFMYLFLLQLTYNKTKRLCVCEMYSKTLSGNLLYCFLLQYDITIEHE